MDAAVARRRRTSAGAGRHPACPGMRRVIAALLSFLTRRSLLRARRPFDPARPHRYNSNRVRAWRPGARRRRAMRCHETSNRCQGSRICPSATQTREVCFMPASRGTVVASPAIGAHRQTPTTDDSGIPQRAQCASLARRPPRHPLLVEHATYRRPLDAAACRIPHLRSVVLLNICEFRATVQPRPRPVSLISVTCHPTSEPATSDRFSHPEAPRAPNVPMSEFYPSIAQCAIVATALKVLLFPA